MRWITSAALLCGLLAGLSAPLRAETGLVAERIAGGFVRPVFVAAPPNDLERLFVVEQHTGNIRIIDLASRQVQSQPFLTVTGLTTGNEQGLLGLAFDPDYAANGHFYVNFTDTVGTTHVRRYATSAANRNLADAASARTVITYAQPFSNHNAGWLGFGPDGYLYITSGDGGSGNDPQNNAQQTVNNKLGKILRLDVRGDDFPADAQRNYAIPPSNPFVGRTGDDEIWSYGLRNPWRASFDRQTGDFWIGDVGQGAREEINFRPVTSAGGENYGWRVMEGSLCSGLGGGPPCNDPSLTPPLLDYVWTNTTADVRGGRSVTGGYVYRGQQIPDLQGTYFYADFYGRLWSLRRDGTQVVDHRYRLRELTPTAGSLNWFSSFGEDGAGELYVMNHVSGEIFKIVADRSKLLPAGSVWRYLDNGSNQGTVWRQPDFDDAAWKSAGGPFGYGDPHLFRLVDFGPSATNRYITTYFRKEFVVEDPSLIATVRVGLMRDDGASVYLNGTEILRENLPGVLGDGTISFTTLALVAVGSADESRYFESSINPQMLRAGRNVLAVEVHQQAASSSDKAFDLEMSATFRTPRPGDADFDGRVDRRDLVVLAANYGLSEWAMWSQGNFNADRRVGLRDLAVWQKNLDPPAAAAVPEPSGCVLLALGAWMVVPAALRRRRRRQIRPGGGVAARS